MAPYPPELLRPDPLALYGRTDEPGNGEVVIVQNNPQIADTIVRNANGYWENSPELDGLPWQLAGLKQEENGGRPARTNYTGLTAGVLKEEAATLVTKEAVLVPIPVGVGDIFTKIGVLTTKEAESPTHSWAALYVGEKAEPAVIEQSADSLTAAIAKEILFSWKLKAPVTITTAMAPHGFIYAAVSVTATTAVPTLIGWASPAVVNKTIASITGAPLGAELKFSVSGTEGVAKSPTGTLTSGEKVPLVVLY